MKTFDKLIIFKMAVTDTVKAKMKKRNGKTPRGLGMTACEKRGPIPFTDGGLPLVDLHAHPEGGTIEAIVALSQEHGVKFGMVEHAGTKENVVYPGLLSCDADLIKWTSSLEGKGVYKGVQAEWTDWSGCFSREALATLDYVLMDTLTFPGPNGRRVLLWEKDAEIGEDPERFMDRYVDWHIEILTTQPIDILANVSWIPEKFGDAYETLWSPARLEKVIQALLQAGVAMEINSGFRLPRMSFLRAAKGAGVKFCFGSNAHYPNMGLLDYPLEMARTLGLSASDMWLPGANGPRACRG